MLVPSLMCILIPLSALLCSGENLSSNGTPLHHLMTSEEIKRLFGVEQVSDVPEYDVTSPFKADEEGSFLTYSLNHRSKRSFPVDDDDNATTYHYIMDFSGEQLHLQVKRNTKFMAPDLQLETHDKEGRQIRKPVSRKSFVTGKVASDSDSVVALSVTDGLTGIVRRSRGTFFIHPLPAHLARHVKGKGQAIPHLVYRRSPLEGSDCQTKPDKIALTKRDDLATKRQLQEQSSDNGITDKYLEVALLADEQIVARHGNMAEDFLLLTGSITDGIFQDATIGNIKINFVITRLVLITNAELGIDPSDASIRHTAVLAKVAEWARNNNNNDQSDSLQFDVAVFIRSERSGALARYGGICKNNDVASVVRENGLQTAYVIAHEVAHNLGVGHDSASKGCPNLVNIMSTVFQGGPGSVEWSSCSMKTIQDFLVSSNSVCLDDVPSSTRPTPSSVFQSMLPGQQIDADEQCEIQYGVGYKRCPQRKTECSSLYCTDDGRNCRSLVFRPLDGTACGFRSWCIKGECVDNGSPMTNGGWSEWSDYTACTPSCDGGVRYRERTCTNPPPQNGGDDCHGPSKAFWEICNSDIECDWSEPSFREQQCKQINSNYTVYYPPNANPCTLVCRIKNVGYPHGYVIDGTRCSKERYDYDVCIQGQCQEVGCDHILHSGKAKDRCGICNGNGDSCTLVQSYYNKDYKNWNKPDEIVVLPVGTSRAVFQQRNVKQYNVIGIQDENGTYLIPLITWKWTVVYNAGTRIYYKNNYDFPDLLEIDGPTNMTLKIVYVHRDYDNRGNVAVDYHYYRKIESNEPSVPPTCHWITGSWTDCSTGRQTREVRCVRSDDSTPASANCCGENVKPESENLCFEWHLSIWQSCTKTCGKGSQSRSVVCQSKTNDTHYKIESDSRCNATTKPIGFRYCNEIKCQVYRAIHWSECSKVCVPGERTSYTKCSRVNERGQIEEVSDIQCGHLRKPTSITETCNNDNPCKDYEIGCFKTPSGLFSENLGNFAHEADRNQALMECGELAHNKSYNVFALGFGGLCLSGADAQRKYYLYKPPAKKTKCSDGIGLGPHSVVYSFDPLPEFEPVGCFKDKLSDRALPDYYASFRPFIDWHNMNATIRQCALVARDIGYEYFAVQYYGECWSSFDAALTYEKHGVQTNPSKCWANVGAGSTNYVYRFRQVQA